MKKQTSSIDNLRVAAPCSVGWERMNGDERVRFCDECQLHVYNISEMTGAQVGALLLKTEGRICGRLYRRADGTLLTRDCPVGLRALRRRASRTAGAALAALLSMCSFAFGQSVSKKDQSCTHVSQLKIKRTATAQNQQGIFTGVLTDVYGAVLAGVKISLTDERTKRKTTATTTEEGEFNFAVMLKGNYTVEIKAGNFMPFKLKHLELNTYEAARADLILQATGESVTVGIIVDAQGIESSNGTTTFRGEIIQKLPIPE